MIPPPCTAYVHHARATYTYYYDLGTLCPLCRTHDGTQRMRGTDKRLCIECTQDRPLELIVQEVTA